MQEDAHDYFLSAKARFQNSEDEEDAADLYFAAQNLANHGHEVEWDATLQKMEGLLKAREADPERPRQRLEPASREEEKVTPKIPSMPLVLPSPDESAFLPREGKPPSPRRGARSTWKRWTSERGTDLRPVWAQPVGSSFPEKRIEGKLVSGFFQALHSGKGNAFWEQAKDLRFPLALEENSEAINERRADRSPNTGVAGKECEIAGLGLWIENGPNPQIYEELLDYHHPDSPFYVKKMDPILDAEVQKILEENAPYGSDKARMSVTASTQGAYSPLRRVEEEDSEVSDVSRKLERYREHIGVLNDDIIGIWPKEMRSRIHEYRFLKWQDEYRERFPESTLTEEDQRKVFLDHVMLEIDGLGHGGPLGGQIWNLLYRNDGQPLYDLPQPGSDNTKCGYKQISRHEDYDSWRSKRYAVGTEQWRHGLLLVPPGDATRMFLADEQHKAGKTILSLIGDDGEPEFEDVPDEYMSQIFHEDEGTGELKALMWPSDDKRNSQHVMIDGTLASPLTSEEIHRFMSMMKFVVTNSMAQSWVNPVDTPRNAAQQRIALKDVNLVKRTLKRALDDAHRYQIQGAAKWQSKGAGENPIRQALKYKGAKKMGYGWNDMLQIPDVPLDNWHDLTDFINKLKENEVIDADTYTKLHDYCHTQLLGADTYAEFFKNPMSSNRNEASKMQHSFLLDPVEPVPPDKYSSADNAPDQLPTIAKAGIFAPTQLRFSKYGNLGYQAQDVMSVLAQWAHNDFVPITDGVIGLQNDYRTVLEPDHPEYDEFLRGLGPLGEEIRNADIEQPQPIDIYAGNVSGNYPLLRYRLEEMYDGKDALGEGSLNRLLLKNLKAQAVWMHERSLTEEVALNHPLSKKNQSDLETTERAHIDASRRVFTTENEGASGALPIGAAWVGPYLGWIPPMLTINMVQQGWTRPIDRVLTREGEVDVRTTDEKIAEASARKKPLRAANVPSLEESRPVEGAEEMWYDGRVLGRIMAAASTLWAGRNHTVLDATLYPGEAAKARLNHAQKFGNHRLEDGEGHGSRTGGRDSWSFNHRQTARERRGGNAQIQSELIHKYLASLWGKAGTEPLRYNKFDGEAVLHDEDSWLPAGTGKTVLGAHLGGKRLGPTTKGGWNVPFLDLIAGFGAHTSIATAPERYTKHPTLFTPDGVLNNIFAAMLGRKGRRRYATEHPITGQPLPRDKRTWLEEQPLPVLPSYRDVLASEELMGKVPQYYRYYVHPQKGTGRFHLPLTPMKEMIPGQKNTTLHGPIFAPDAISPHEGEVGGEKLSGHMLSPGHRQVSVNSAGEVIPGDFVPPLVEGDYLRYADRCPTCMGSRKDNGQKCETCKGSGRDLEGRQGNIYHFLHTNNAMIPSSVKVNTEPGPTDEMDRHWVLGPHPAQFIAQWLDAVHREAPRHPEILAAERELNMHAKELLEVDMPNGLPQTDETADPDVLYRSGLNPAQMHLITRHAMNVAHAFRVTWPVMEANAAINYSRFNRAEYVGLSLSDIIAKFRQDKLEVHDAHDEGEVLERRKRIFYILKDGFDFISGFDPEHNTRIIENLWTKVHFENKQGVADEWKDRLSEMGVSLEHEDDNVEWKYSGYTAHCGLNKYRTDEYDGAEEHPLYEIGRTALSGGREVMGHDILAKYLKTHPAVQEAMIQLGKNPEEWANRLVDDDDSFEERAFPIDDYPAQTSGNRDAMRSVFHYSHGAPLDEAGEPIPLHYITPSGRGTSVRESKKGAHYGGTYMDTLVERGRHARRALAAVRWVEERLKGPGRMNFMDTYGSLLRDPVEGNSVMGVILNELRDIKDNNGLPAFSEHYNALMGGSNTEWKDRSIQDRAAALMRFFFCQGSRSELSKTGKSELVSTQWPVIGQHEDLSEHNSSIPPKFDLSKGKLDTAIFNPRMLHLYGTRYKVPQDPSFERETEPVERLPAVSEEHGWAGDEARMSAMGMDSPFIEFHPHVLNDMLGFQLDFSDRNNFQLPPAADAATEGIDTTMLYSYQTGLDVLTDVDLLYKAKNKDSGKPVPIKAMHRLFSMDELEFFKGFSGDWIASSWPIGQRLIVSRKSNIVNAYDSDGKTFSLSNEVRSDVRAAFDINFLVDCIWDGETLHIVDILKSGDKEMETDLAKDRVRHLRANFAATEKVSIPAPINTKRVDSEGLGRAVKDLYKEKGVKQIMLRDADSTYMRGETRHPKWLLLTKEHQLDVIVLECGGAVCRLGVGPILEHDAKKMGNRAVEYDGQYYMDVGSLTSSSFEEGQYITVKTSNVTTKGRDALKVFTLHGAKYMKDSEAHATDSLQTLDLLSGEKNPNVPHKLRVNKGSVHLDFPIGHVVYDTESYGHAFLIKGVDSPNEYLFSLAESQREYWEPLAAVLLRSEVESKKSKKANVVPEPPANHDKKPKKVLKPEERILKDPKLTKGLVTALEVLDDILKEKITWTGPKGLGIDFGTPVESPSGPTELTEPKNLPDHDPGHRQEKGGDCWCGAKRGQECEQGLAHTMENCPKAHPPRKEEDKKHIKIPIS